MMKFLREVESSKNFMSSLQRVKKLMRLKTYKYLDKNTEMPSLATNPISPQTTKNFILGMLLSFLGFFGLIFYKELNNSVLKS